MRERLTEMEKSIIEKKAQDLLDKYKVDVSNGLDIIELATKMGFAVGHAPLPDTEDGFINIDKRKKTLGRASSNMIIGVNDQLGYTKRRFVVAHEIGHYVLEEGVNSLMFAHRDKNAELRNEDERDKDYFAACLLMPRKEFTQKYHEINKNNSQIYWTVEKLYRIFKAPYISVIRRLEELGMITVTANS